MQAQALVGEIEWSDIWPPLVYKCFTDDNLEQLAALRQAILEFNGESHVRDFLKLALTSTLRIVTTAGAGWPYIAPSKYHSQEDPIRTLSPNSRRVVISWCRIYSRLKHWEFHIHHHELLLGRR